jgi:hypothetical protein
MQVNKDTLDALIRIGKSHDGKTLINFLKELVTSTSDVRKIINITTEDVKGRQLACSIIEDEILSRFATASKDGINKENYE